MTPLIPVPMLIPTLTPVPSPTPTPSPKQAGTGAYSMISRVSERKKESERMKKSARTQKELGVVAQYTTVSTTQGQWCCLTCRERGNATGFLNIIASDENQQHGGANND